MSFKLFVASTFGLIKPTAKIESAFEALKADYLMFANFENSEEFKELNELELTVNSATFRQQKKEIQLLGFKGSKEAAELADFRKLEKNSRLRKFFTTEKAAELKRFETIMRSGLPEKFSALRKYTGSGEFRQAQRNAKGKGKQAFETTEAFSKLQEYKKLQATDDVKFYLSFEKSAAYKNYRLMKDSAERKRFYELQEITGSDEFKKRVAYLEDKQKWEKTAEYKKELRLAELQKLPQTLNYRKYKNSDAFDFFRKWKLVFEDRFESGKLDSEKWEAMSHWGKQALGRNFSQPGDLQAFTEGKNINLAGNALKIEVRKERAKGMVWKIPFGFVEEDFDYTSGWISTAGGDWWNHGILEAKVKYEPVKGVVDAIYLLGEERSPQINLVEMGVKNRVGTLSQANGEVDAACEDISGLKTGEFYIFRLEWTSHALVWKINGREILTINLHVPSHAMYLNATSVVVSEPQGNLPHRFEIDWVRFYQPVKS